jgi:predicted nucleic acid-binding protein
MNLVVDASVVIKWFVDEIDSDAARRLLADERWVFCIPAHAHGAIGNVVARHARHGVIARAQVREIVGALAEHTTTYPIGPLLTEAIELAVDLGQSVYDTLYLALAVDLGCVVSTADERLIRAVRNSSWEQRVLSVAAVLR